MRNRADSQLVGSIYYAGRRELDKPIHNLRVEFWARTQLYQWRLLSAGYSDTMVISRFRLNCGRRATGI